MKNTDKIEFILKEYDEFKAEIHQLFDKLNKKYGIEPTFLRKDSTPQQVGFAFHMEELETAAGNLITTEDFVNTIHYPRNTSDYEQLLKAVNYTNRVWFNVLKSDEGAEICCIMEASGLVVDISWSDLLKYPMLVGRIELPNVQECDATDL